MIVTLEYGRRSSLWSNHFPSGLADVPNVHDLMREIETNAQEHELFVQRNDIKVEGLELDDNEAEGAERGG